MCVGLAVTHACLKVCAFFNTRNIHLSLSGEENKYEQ